MPLDPHSYRAPEAVHFQSSLTAPAQVWN